MHNIINVGMKCSLKGKQFSSRTNHPLIGWFSTWKTWFSKKLVLGLKYSMMKNKCIRVLKTSGKHWFTSCWPSQGSASPLLLLCIYDSNDFFFFFLERCVLKVLPLEMKFGQDLGWLWKNFVNQIMKNIDSDPLNH